MEETPAGVVGDDGDTGEDVVGDPAESLDRPSSKDRLASFAFKSH